MGDNTRRSDKMEETVHASISDVTTMFRFRGFLALASGGIAGGLGFIGIVASVNQIDGNLATFIAGVAACIVAFNMITNWGASDGHCRLARLAAQGHERLNKILTNRLDGIEKIERETGNAVVIALDDLRDLRDRRRRHGG